MDISEINTIFSTINLSPHSSPPFVNKKWKSISRNWLVKDSDKKDESLKKTKSKSNDKPISLLETMISMRNDRPLLIRENTSSKVLSGWDNFPELDSVTVWEDISYPISHLYDDEDLMWNRMGEMELGLYEYEKEFIL